MAAQPPKTKTPLKKLQETWYKKLADSGFEDIEADEWNLKKSFKSTMLKTKHGLIRSGRWQASHDYYYMAEHFLNSHVFKSKLDRIIWEYHSNGISVRDIGDLLKEVGINTSHQTVYITIKGLADIMKKQARAGNE